MIDYFVIVYLMKKFGFDKKFTPKRYKLYKALLFVTLSVISIVRLMYFRVDLMNIYIGPFYLIGHLEMFGLLIITLFFYAGILLLPFVLVLLTPVGFLVGAFLPNITYSLMEQEYKERCSASIKEVPQIIGSLYCDRYYLILASHFKYEEFIKQSIDHLDRYAQDLVNNPPYDCDISNNTRFEISKNHSSSTCASLKSRKYHYLSDIEFFVTGLETVDINHWLVQIENHKDDNRKWNHFNNWSSAKRPDGVYRVWTYFNQEQCIDMCKELPKRMKAVGGYRKYEYDTGRFAQSVTGEMIYPLKCKWRCSNRDRIMKLMLKYAKLGCEDIIVNKEDGWAALDSQSSNCGKYDSLLRDNGQLGEAEAVSKRHKYLQEKRERWREEGVPRYYNGK